jgi:hypothetical protein
VPWLRRCGARPPRRAPVVYRPARCGILNTRVHVPVLVVSEFVRLKAHRLLRTGRVIDLGDGEFIVRGDHGTYGVMLPARRLDRGGSCDCPAWRACSHIEACKLLVAGEVGACA